ncbi:hypothetical protein ACP4OV_012796 [Aristida adscensionis]
MDDAAACNSGGAPNAAQLFRRLTLQQHTPCCPGIERRGCCCDAGVLDGNESRHCQEQIPSWVGDLAAADLSALCRKSRFCPTCLAGFCGRRCPTAHQHAAGQGAGDAIEIHVLGEGDSLRTFVDVLDVDGLCECSEVELEVDLAPAPTMLRRLVPLHPAGLSCAKRFCGSIRVGDESLYCSMDCQAQWQAGKGRPCNQFVRALLAEDFATGHLRDAFCTSCRAVLCAAALRDHAGHPFVKIVSDGGGRFFARIPDGEEWLGSLGDLALVQEDGEGYRLLPLTPPPPQESTSVAM